jgi:hypothetical protein
VTALQSEIGILEEEALRVGEATPGVSEKELTKLVKEGQLQFRDTH